MNTNILLYPEKKSIAGIVPSVSIFLPFEPKMSSPSDIAASLKRVCDRAIRLVNEKYTSTEAELVFERLRLMIDHLDFHTYKKSIALFVSPLVEKLLYLDIAVEPKVVVDEAFEIRDLVYSKKRVHKYLVLVLGTHESRIFLGNTSSFVKILSKNGGINLNQIVPESIADLEQFNFSNRARKEKFFNAVDQSLDIILKAYKLPLYVLGEAGLLSDFSCLSKHSEAVVEYIHGDYENAGGFQLKELLEPYIEDWQMVIQKDLLQQLVSSDIKKQLTCGIENVWKASLRKSLRLLLVEKNYMYPKSLLLIGEKDISEQTVNEPKDAVDEAIESVLTDGGDVEFVEEGVLENYGKIVGIKK